LVKARKEEKREVVQKAHVLLKGEKPLKALILMRKGRREGEAIIGIRTTPQ